ncbi:MAG: hypothetical protein ACYCOY_01595 [Metallibacterium sp.]
MQRRLEGGQSLRVIARSLGCAAKHDQPRASACIERGGLTGRRRRAVHGHEPAQATWATQA